MRTLGGDSRDTSFVLSKERDWTKAFPSSTLNNLNYTINSIVILSIKIKIIRIL